MSDDDLPEMTVEFSHAVPADLDFRSASHPTEADYIFVAGVLPKGLHLGEVFDLPDDGSLILCYATGFPYCLGAISIKYV